MLTSNNNNSGVVVWDIQTGRLIRPLCPILLGQNYAWAGWLLLVSALAMPLKVFVRSASKTEEARSSSLHTT